MTKPQKPEYSLHDPEGDEAAIDAALEKQQRGDLAELMRKVTRAMRTGQLDPFIEGFEMPSGHEDYDGDDSAPPDQGPSDPGGNM